MMKNKKGQIAMIMLFIVAIVLSISALFVFLTLSTSNVPFSRTTSQMMSDAIFADSSINIHAKGIAKEGITANPNEESRAVLEDNYMKSAEKRYTMIGEFGNFFGKIRNHAFEFRKVRGDYLLKVNGLFITAGGGNSEMTRTFDLCLVFDNSGQYIYPSRDVDGVYKSECPTITGP